VIACRTCPDAGHIRRVAPGSADAKNPAGVRQSPSCLIRAPSGTGFETEPPDEAALSEPRLPGTADLLPSPPIFQTAGASLRRHPIPPPCRPALRRIPQATRRPRPDRPRRQTHPRATDKYFIGPEHRKGKPTRFHIGRNLRIPVKICPDIKVSTKPPAIGYGGSGETGVPAREQGIHRRDARPA